MDATKALGELFIEKKTLHEQYLLLLGVTASIARGEVDPKRFRVTGPDSWSLDAEAPVAETTGESA